jgi:hypothetical protein
MDPRRKSKRTAEMCIDETVGCPEQLARPKTHGLQLLHSRASRIREETGPGYPPDCPRGLSLDAFGDISFHYRIADLRAGKTDPHLIMRSGVPVKSIHDL